MKEDKILPQTYLFFSKNFPNFSMIQLNEVFDLATTCFTTRNSRREGSVWKRHHSFFQKGLGWVVTTKCSKIIAQNVKQGLAWIWCRFWKRENSVTWSTSLSNIFWSFFIYKVISITNESWKYLVFTQIQQYIPPWNKFLHITKTMFFYIFLSVFPQYISNISSNDPI